MVIISILFLIFCFLKSFYYGLYEIQNNNFASGKLYCFISVLALIFPIFMIIRFYL